MTALRFKLDENVPVEAVRLLGAAGYSDCHTVYTESMAGAPDTAVASACVAGSRVLITLDLDFSDIRAYPLGSHSGIIVLRPRDPDRESVLAILERTLPVFLSEPILGCLWVVDTERVRIRPASNARGTGGGDGSQEDTR